MTQYRNILSLRQAGKGIPYGGSGFPRGDGAANHGFKNLKSDPLLIDSVPELKDDKPLRSLVVSINLLKTDLFSVGCESGPVVEAQGHRRSGYVEFAFNSRTAVSDAAIYFPLFFHFDGLLFKSKFAHRVQFDWELQPAYFADVKVNGFTCAVFINTHFYPTSDGARECWDAALSVLEQHLGSVTVASDDPIYAPAP